MRRGNRLAAVLVGWAWIGSPPSSSSWLRSPLLAGGRVVEGPDETSGLWSSITIGPGRQALLRSREDLPADVSVAPGDIGCELGEPDLRDNSHRSAGRSLDPDLVTMAGCTDGALLGVENPTDAPIGVYVVTEFYDARGFSTGQIEMGQYPTTYTDGRPVTSCEVLTARFVVDPPPSEVIVD